MRYFTTILIICFTFFSCSSNKKTTSNSEKIKTYRHSDFTFNYPKNWKTYGAIEHVFLSPKKIKKAFPQDEKNFIQINKNILYSKKSTTVENALKTHGNTMSRSEKDKQYKIVSIENHPLYIYKMESIIKYKNDNDTYKRMEFFYIINNQLKLVKIQLKDSIFDEYFNDAMLIINSFKPKD